MRKKSGSAARLGAPSRPGGRCRGSPSPPCPDGGGSGAGVTEAAAEVELEAAHGGRRAPAGRDGTGRNRTGLPLHAAAESCCAGCSTQAPQLPAAVGERLRTAGRPPARPSPPPPPATPAGPGRAAPCGPSRPGPPPTGLPCPAAAPGSGEAAQERLLSRKAGNPRRGETLGESGLAAGREGERLPCRNQGVPKGSRGTSVPVTPGCAPLPRPPATQLWEGSLGRVQQPGGSPIGRPLSVPLSVGKQWRNAGFDPILMSAETAAGRGCWRGQGQGMPVCQGR